MNRLSDNACLKSFYLGTVLANPFIRISADLIAARIDALQTVGATVSARDEEDSDGSDVHAEMHGSESGSGLARDDVKLGDTMQESRPAHLATAPSEANSGAPQPRREAAQTNATQPAASPNLDSLDCIAEIFASHAKSDRRFTLNTAKFELALIDPPPLRNVA
jgi:hypothetical protein